MGRASALPLDAVGVLVDAVVDATEIERWFLAGDWAELDVAVMLGIGDVDARRAETEAGFDEAISDAVDGPADPFD